MISENAIIHIVNLRCIPLFYWDFHLCFYEVNYLVIRASLVIILSFGRFSIFVIYGFTSGIKHAFLGWCINNY